MRANSTRADQKMKMRFSLLVLSILAVILFPIGAGARKLKFTTCGKPLPLQLRPFTHKPQRIDYLCGNTGCPRNAANDKQNAQKNNFCASLNPITQVTLDTFSTLNDASNNEPSIPKGEPPPSRAKLANIITIDNFSTAAQNSAKERSSLSLV